MVTNGRWRPIAWTAVLLPLGVLAWLAGSTVAGRPGQPLPLDLDAYQAAADAWLAGRDPYKWEDLSPGADRPQHRPWVYPRAVLPVVAPLACLPFDAPTHRAWRLAEALALGVGLVAAWRASGRPWLGAAALAAGLLVWHRALEAVLVQGNLEAFAVALVATGLAAGRLGRGRLAGVLVGIGALPKLWPFALLAVPWLRDRATGRRALVAGLVLLGVLLGFELASATPFALLPKVRAMDDRAPIEPSLRALLADLHDDGGWPSVWLTWPVAALAVGGATAWAARRAGPGSARDALVWLSLLVVLPRVQDYGWLHAIAPAAWAWAAHPASWLGLVVAAVAWEEGWRYAPWWAAAATWAGLAAALAWRRRPTAEPPG